MAERTIRLYGRLFLKMNVRAVTGLRIGGAPAGLAIGSLDNPVIRDPLTQQPYIPGSSLRGKMRSLWERHTGVVQNFAIRRSKPEVYIHTLPDGSSREDYENDPVCRIFGATGDSDVPNPTRLIVHDSFLGKDSVKALESARTDQPYTETKWEAVIDRVTSAAVPRQMERVPAGVVFEDCRLVYSVYGSLKGMEDVDWFFDVLQMLQLVEDDYLGSSGSRGSGRVRFEHIRLSARSSQDYATLLPITETPIEAVSVFLQSRTELSGILHDIFSA